MPLVPARYDHCVITGASSGIGREFGELLAQRGARHLTLVARREQRLVEFADRWQRAGALSISAISVDLAEPDGPGRLLERLASGAGGPVDLLVNNAGFGRYGRFTAFPWDDHRRMYQLNMVTPLELIHGLWDQLVAEPGRGVINVASTAAFQPIPFFTSYAATKAFLRSASDGLAGESRALGLRMLALCPGPVPTEFGEIAGTKFRVRKVSTTPRSVVEAALGAYEAGRVELIPGRMNGALRFAVRFAPLKPLLHLASRFAGTVER